MDWKRKKVGPIKSFPDAFISIFLFSISIFWFEEPNGGCGLLVMGRGDYLFSCSVFEHRLCDYFSEAYGGLLPTAPSPPPRDCLRPVTNQFSVRPQPLTLAIFGQIFLKNGEIWPFFQNLVQRFKKWFPVKNIYPCCQPLTRAPDILHKNCETCKD